MESIRKKLPRRQSTLSDADLDFIVANTSNSDKDMLRKQFANFCEQCPDGHIDRKNFRLLMRSCHPGRNLERLEKRIFNMYDENRDGRISFAEFMVVMYVMSNGTPEENFRQIFRILDADGNGVITLSELKKVVKDIFKLLSDDDKEAAKDKANLTLAAFAEMDANKDGEVTEAEFLAAIRSNEKMTSLLTLKVVEIFDSGNK